MSDEGNERDKPEHRREIMVGIVLPSAALVASVAFWAHNVFVDITDHVLVISERVAANTTHRIAHEREAEQWIARIMANEQLGRELERAVTKLQTQPDARADPFTGKDGRVLDGRIKKLEQRLGDE